MLSSRDIALIASMSALYAAYSFLSSNTIGNFIHGVDTFFIRSLLFVVLSFSTAKTGVASLMGLVSGMIIEFTTPSPIHFYIFPSVLTYGVVYDIFLWKFRALPHPRTSTVLMATVLSSVAMATAALSVFTYVSFFSPEILPIIWVFGILRDVVMGLIGACVGVKISRAVYHI